uniref:RAP domain-containing protein n=1 Tax=Strongyloides venezuelensis TaxID=75913 RepID=A0A0K0FUU3_STRVS
MIRFQWNTLLLGGVSKLLKVNSTIAPSAALLCGSVDKELLNILSSNNEKINIVQENIKPLYMTPTNLDDLEKHFAMKRPKNSVELVDYLNHFEKFLVLENSIKALELFTKEKIDTAIKAHILSQESGIDAFFRTSIFFVKFLALIHGDLSKLDQKGSDFDLLNSLLNRCYEDMKDKSFSQLPIDSLIQLYFTLKQHNGQFININLLNLLEEKVLLNVNDTTSIVFIFRVLKVMDLTPDQYKTVFKKAQELLPNLSINDAANLMYHISLTRNRPLTLLQEIVQRMEFIDDNSITLSNMAKLTQALETLSFHSIHALRIICRNFVKSINTYKNANQITSVLCGLSTMNCGNDVVWKLAEKWLENNYREIDLKNILPMVTVLGKINCPTENIEIPLNYFNKAITINRVSNSYSWLRYVYGMTILGKLTPRMAESVLREEFINDLLKKRNDSVKFFMLNLVAQIDCAARTEISDYKLPMFLLDKYMDNDKNLIERTSNMLYDKRALNFITTADIAVKRIVGSEKKLSGPRILENGILVNNIISPSFNSNSDSVINWDKFIKSNLPKTCIVYISNKQMLKDVDTGACVRENGTVALKIRLLNKLGFNVVKIYEHEFNKNTTAIDNINYVKNEIEKHLKL